MKKGKTHLWIKINRGIVNSTRDIYLCAIYILPSNSPYYTEEIFQELQKEIIHFQSLGLILICGDLNARTGKEKDYIEVDGNKHIFGQISPVPAHAIPQTQRQSFDNIINKNGRQVLQICKSLGLYIANGRTRGDSLGRMTYSSVLGNSVVDYTITDIDPEDINAFVVSPQLPFSDHCQTTLYLNKSTKYSFVQESETS